MKPSSRVVLNEKALRDLAKSPTVAAGMKIRAEEVLRSIRCPVHGSASSSLHLVDTPVAGRYKVEGDVCCIALENVVAEQLTGMS